LEDFRRRRNINQSKKANRRIITAALIPIPADAPGLSPEDLADEEVDDEEISDGFVDVGAELLECIGMDEFVEFCRFSKSISKIRIVKSNVILHAYLINVYYCQRVNMLFCEFRYDLHSGRGSHKVRLR
jgi:hypothetical protein